MNLFNEAIYRSHLEHSAKGQEWGSHKYIRKENGRYIYPSDLSKGAAKVSSASVINGRKVGSAADKDRAKKEESQIRSAHQGDVARSTTTTSTSTNKTVDRATQVAQQIKSAHSAAAGRKSTSTGKKKTETAPTATTTSTTDDTKKTTTDTEEKKKSSGKGGGKKSSGGSSSKKKSSGKKSSKTAENTQQTTSAASSEEAKALGLSDDDIKNLESAIDLNSTERSTVINNLAIRVIKGDFGDGEDRKKKLGKYYSEIQKKVNELIKTMGGGTQSSGGSYKSTSKKSSNTKSASTKYGDAGYYKQTGKNGTTINNRKTITHSDGYAFNVMKENGVMGVLSATTNSLMHIGTKTSGRYPRGSGDRPYQHDGSYRRSNSTYDSLVRKKTVKDMTDDELKKNVARAGLEKQYKKLNKQKTGLERAKDVSDAASSGINRASNRLREKSNRRPKRERMNLDHMSDEELRKAINRENLERQYSDLFGPEVETVSDGEKKVARILDTAGDVLAFGTTAITLALAIKGKL